MEGGALLPIVRHPIAARAKQEVGVVFVAQMMHHNGVQEHVHGADKRCILEQIVCVPAVFVTSDVPTENEFEIIGVLREVEVEIEGDTAPTWRRIKNIKKPDWGREFNQFHGQVQASLQGVLGRAGCFLASGLFFQNPVSERTRF